HDIRATQLANAAFDAHIWEIFPYLCFGGCIYIVNEHQLDILKFPHWIAENKISHCFLPTPLGEIFLTHVEPKHPSLKFLLLGGDKLKPLKRIMNFFVVNH